MTAKNSILAQLPKLKPGELREVLAILNDLVGRKLSDDENDLYQALREVLGSHGVQFPRGFTKNPVHIRLWKTHLSPVQDLLCKFQARPGTPLAYNLKKFMWGLLVADLVARHVPVSLGSVISNMGRVPEVFEAAFPGYLKAGCAGLIPKAMLRRQPAKPYNLSKKSPSTKKEPNENRKKGTT